MNPDIYVIDAENELIQFKLTRGVVKNGFLIDVNNRFKEIQMLFNVYLAYKIYVKTQIKNCEFTRLRIANLHTMSLASKVSLFPGIVANFMNT